MDDGEAVLTLVRDALIEYDPMGDPAYPNGAPELADMQINAEDRDMYVYIDGVAWRISVEMM